MTPPPGSQQSRIPKLATGPHGNNSPKAGPPRTPSSQPQPSPNPVTASARKSLHGNGPEPEVQPQSSGKLVSQNKTQTLITPQAPCEPEPAPKPAPAVLQKAEQGGQGQGDIHLLDITVSKDKRIASFLSVEAEEEKIRELLEAQKKEDERASLTKVRGEEGEGDQPGSTSTDPDAAPKKGPGPDMNVLYAPNPLRMDSTSVFVGAGVGATPEKDPKQLAYKRSPTYLEIYRQKKELSELYENDALPWRKRRETTEMGTQYSEAKVPQKESSQDAPEDPSSASLEMEWDYGAGGEVDKGKEVQTQTSSRRIATGSSIFNGIVSAEESFSRDSLLDEASPPSVIYRLTTTEQEDSDSEEDLGEGERGQSSRFFDEEEEEEIESEFYYDEDELMPRAGIPLASEVETEVEEEAPPKGKAPVKKPKTIFSVDLPVTGSKVESGPGENGDGHYVTRARSSQAKLKVSQSKMEVEREEEEVMVEKIHVRAEDGKREESSGKPAAPRLSSVWGSPFELQNWSTEAMIPRVRSDPAARFEIRPSPVPISPEQPPLPRPGYKGEKEEEVKEAEMGEGKAGHCEAILSKSSLILQKEKGPDGSDVWRGSFPIMNSTSFKHGFKIIANASSKKHLSLSPKMGLIPPKTELRIKVETREGLGNVKAEKLSRDKIGVNIFRSFCEEGELHKYYEKLTEQHPELIQSQSIQDVLLWDLGDLPGMLKVLESVEDPEERSSFKAKFHAQYKDRVLPEVRRKAELNAVKNDMLIANQQLRGIHHDLGELRQALHALIFIGIVVFGFTMIAPYLSTGVVVPEVKVQPEVEPSLYDGIVETLHGVWDSMMNNMPDLNY